MKIPAKIEENTFDTETVLDATLYVPQGSIENMRMPTIGVISK